MISAKTLYLTADRQKAVEESDPKAQFLLVRAGQEIPDALAEKYGVKAGKSASESDTGSPHPQNREADVSLRTRDAGTAVKTAAKKSGK